MGFLRPQLAATPEFIAQAAQPAQGTNVLQQMGAPTNAAPPRERRSVLDTLGKLSDVFAKVGGADALYQPTLDARQDRGFAIEDRNRAIEMDRLRQTQAQQAITQNAGEIGDAENARLGQAVRGLRAITAANPQANIAQIWPLIAKQAGLPDERVAALGEAITQNPALLEGLASATGAGREFGLQPFYAKDANGQLRAYQLGKDGTIAPVALPAGATPIDPLKFVDTGGAMVGVGTRSGNPARILPKSERPGAAQDRASRERIAAEGNRTRIQVAGMRPNAGGKDAAAPATQQNARALLQEMRSIYGDLNKSGALVNPENDTGTNIAARARSSGVGQLLEGAVGTRAQTLRDRVNSIRPALLQALAKATGMTGRQLDSNADVKLFMQTVTDPTKSYQANIAAINGLERFLAENSAKGARPAAPTARRPAAPARRTAPASSGGWSVVGVK